MRWAIVLCLAGCADPDVEPGRSTLWFGNSLWICQRSPLPVAVVAVVDPSLDGDPRVVSALGSLEDALLDLYAAPAVEEVRLSTIVEDGAFLDAAANGATAAIADGPATIAIVVFATTDDASDGEPTETAERIARRIGDARSVVAGVLAPVESSPRLVAFAEAVESAGGRGLVGNVRADDFDPAMVDLAVDIRETLERSGECLQDPMWRPDGSRAETGEHVDCVIRATLVDSGDCGPGSFPVGRQRGRAICQLCQAGDGLDGRTHDFDGTDVTACANEAASWRYSTEVRGCEASGWFEMPETPVPDGAIVILACLQHLVAE